ncbi:MAG: hypothetical protein U0795_01090 [Pirellulales bacterium]
MKLGTVTRRAVGLIGAGIVIIMAAAPAVLGQAPFDSHTSRIWGSPTPAASSTTPMRGLPNPPGAAPAASNPFGTVPGVAQPTAGAMPTTSAVPPATQGAPGTPQYGPSSTVPYANQNTVPYANQTTVPYNNVTRTQPAAAGASPNAATAMPPSLLEDSPQYRIGPGQVAPTTPMAGPVSPNSPAGLNPNGASPWTRPGSPAAATAGTRPGNIPWSGSGTAPVPTAGHGSREEAAGSATVYKPTAEAGSPDVSMWVALLAGLFFSLCANAYFIWQAWETYNRYEDLVAEMAEDRGGTSGPVVARRRFRDMRSLADDDHDSHRGRDESLAAS